MAITRVKVRNFKSFDELDVELRPLNIVVGGNAAGKSNFLEIFRFVRDLALHGMENAVSLQGGMEFLANLSLGTAERVSFNITSDTVKTTPLGWDSRRNSTWILRASVAYSTYSISLPKSSDGLGFPSIDEQLLHKVSLEDKRYWGHVLLRRGREALIVPDEEKMVSKAVVDRVVKPGAGDKQFEQELYALFSGIKIFDLDPRLPKKAVPLSGRVDLDPDGSNLAIVLRSILQEEEKRATFVRLLREALPFVEDLKIERFADKSLLIALREAFSDRTYLPAAFLSDGTIHLIALIVALYFDQSEITIIEEPERNIHPHLISRVAAMLKDASRQKQVIVTTHNPELVKHADLEDLLLVQRDERGFSRITRPAESEQLKVFLENDLGVDELYVQNLLGVGHGV